MKTRAFSFLVLLTVISILTASAVSYAGNNELTGKYMVQGWDPGHTDAPSPDYAGEATLKSWGEVMSYRGFMDGMTYAGAALYDPQTKTISLSFTNVDGTERGVTLLKHTGKSFEGKWVLDNGGSGKTGKEIWTKK